MRRSEKEIKDKLVIAELLSKAHVGRLGTIGRDGYPVIKPLNFTFNDGSIYIHTAKEGEKIEDIKRDNRVCFEVDLPIAYLKAKRRPCEADYLYRSVIIKGRASIVEDDGEKLKALKGLMAKHQPEGGYGDYPEDKTGKTGIIRIDIEETVGKEDLGSGKVKEAVLKALTEGVTLPITVERD